MTKLEQFRKWNWLASGVLASALIGCSGGDGSGLQGPPLPPLTATFSSLQANIFTPTCATAGCHSGAGAPVGLLLDDVNSYGLLVNRPSGEVPALLRVAPADPDNSYLIQKLEGTAAVGARMPLNGQPLAQSTINVVRQWISDGAIDDRAPSSDPIRVTSLVPAPDAVVAAPPTDIVAMFDRELDVSTINAATFLVDGSGGDGSFGDGNEIPVAAASISAPTMTPTSATFELGGTVLPDDTYRVQLLGSGASLILDTDANALDGEFSGTFPSGNGIQGGDFSATFVVRAPVTLDDIQASVFDTSCSGCHSGPTSSTLPSGMNLSTADDSFAALVGTASIQVPALNRVTAGDPDNSYLVQKLEGTAAVGGQMPLGGTPLDQAVIDDIRQWISDGAAR